MVSRWHHRGWHYVFLLAAGSCLFLVNLGGASLWDIDEGKNAPCAYEMMASGDWVIPTHNGLLRVDKPALLYWLQIAAYSCLGVNEFAARLPSALAALTTLLLAYELGRAMFGKATGLLGGLIAATTPMLCGAARFANPDSLLHLFTLLTLLIFWLGHRQPTRLWWIGLGAATGLGMLAKGPVALALPGAVGLLFLLWDGRIRTAFDRRLGWAVVTWCLVALPWFIWVGVDTKGAFLRGFFMDHNFGRLGGAMEGHAGTPLYYLIVLVVGMAPWSVFLGMGVWCAIPSVRPFIPGPFPQGGEGANGWADRQQIGHPEVRPGPVSVYRFLLTWIAVYLGFFTLAATKLPNYVLPVVVPCAVLTARFLDRWRQARLAVPNWTWRAAFVVLIAMGLGIGGGLATAGGIGELALLRGRFIPGLATWAWLGLVPLAGAVGAWALWRRECRGGVLVCLTLAALMLLAPMAAWGSAVFNRCKAPAPLVALANGLQSQTDLRVSAWRMEHLPSLNFYVKRDIHHVRSENEMRGLLRYPVPVYVFLPAQLWEQCGASTRGLGTEVARHPDMYRQVDVVLVANRWASEPRTQ